ncbi:hypothetical protein KEJ25_09385 [Candidatus Bathyarchaeota archaeon]|nr:hypothetical protein [Candidatus Bathyarchaeota archaeon]
MTAVEDVSARLKTQLLKLLKEDEGFRYAVAGLIGLEDLKSSMKSLTDAVDRLTEAQKLTEDRLNRLTERVDKLAEAQLRTEDHVKQLAVAVSNLAKEVGRLSDVVGFGLEDVAKVVVPGWLYRHERIEVELERKFVYVDGELIEVNLYGDGRRDGEDVIVVGECKSRIYEREVREFAEKLDKLVKAFQGRRMYTFMFGFLIHPSAEEEARERGITLIASYMR